MFSLRLHDSWVFFGPWVLVSGSVTGCLPQIPWDPANVSAGDDDDSGAGTDPTDSSDSSDSSNPTAPTPPPPTTTTGTPVDPPPDPHPGPPRLIEIRHTSPSVLELVFSEPVQAPSGVDPQKFRLSVATHWSYYGQNNTSYASTSWYTGDEFCYDYCEGGDCDVPGPCCYCYNNSGPEVVPTSLATGPASHLLLLTLSQPLTSSMCTPRRSGEEFQALFLHYTNNGAPNVMDVAGEALDAIAEHWALPPHRDSDWLDGEFPAMDPFLPIPCDP